MSYQCPLCSTDFETATCRSSCPMSRGCAMVRCPRCGYEFVESGRLTDLLLRWIRRGPKQSCAQPPAGDGVMRLIDLDLGATGSVVFIAPSAGSRVARLAAYGIVAGTELRLIARKPTVVLESGQTTIAVEPEIGREIFVRAA
jgi:Fe2+ transport system protein FeoA